MKSKRNHKAQISPVKHILNEEAEMKMEIRYERDYAPKALNTSNGKIDSANSSTQPSRFPTEHKKCKLLEPNMQQTHTLSSKKRRAQATNELQMTLDPIPPPASRRRPPLQISATKKLACEPHAPPQVFGTIHMRRACGIPFRHQLLTPMWSGINDPTFENLFCYFEF